MKKKDFKKQYKDAKRTLKDSYRESKATARETYRCGKYAAMKAYRDGVSELLCNRSKKVPNNPPKRALIEEIGNAVSHGIGSLFAVVAFVLMCIASDSNIEYIGAAAYFVGEMLMFTVSCLYHSFRHGSAVKRLFRRFDYSSIYLMIGGTFAPILLCYSESPLAIWFFLIQWVVIATGITFIGVYGPTRLRWLHFPLYLILGWCGVMFIPEMLVRGDYLLFGLVLGGGVIYSIGVIPFALNKKAAHFIWHFFVLGGAVVQWLGIYLVIYLQ